MSVSENNIPALPIHKILCITQIFNLSLISCRLLLAKLDCQMHFFTVFSELPSECSGTWTPQMAGKLQERKAGTPRRPKPASCSFPAPSGLQLPGCNSIWGFGSVTILGHVLTWYRWWTDDFCSKGFRSCSGTFHCCKHPVVLAIKYLNAFIGEKKCFDLLVKIG